MDERAPNEFPVSELAPFRLDLGPDGELPVCLNHDWDHDPAEIQGVLVMLHGRLRDAPTYFRTAMAAVGSRPGWLVAVPQFLAGMDVAAHGLSPRTLRWSLTGWMGGDAAETPTGLSSFAAVDALLARLTEHLPRPHGLILAGHSGGGQVVQRYAMLGGTRRELRYVVANPSSYAFLTPARPEPVAGCPDYDRWKYGLTDLPAHAAGWTADALGARYAGRDVVYLLGAQDTDPAHPALDISCAARCQGPHRLARGQTFFAALQDLHPSHRHRLMVVPGVGHSGSQIFTSPEGMDALFG